MKRLETTPSPEAEPRSVPHVLFASRLVELPGRGETVCFLQNPDLDLSNIRSSCRLVNFGSTSVFTLQRIEIGLRNWAGDDVQDLLAIQARFLLKVDGRTVLEERSLDACSFGNTFHFSQFVNVRYNDCVEFVMYLPPLSPNLSPPDAAYIEDTYQSEKRTRILLPERLFQRIQKYPSLTGLLPFLMHTEKQTVTHHRPRQGSVLVTAYFHGLLTDPNNQKENT
jgi:hypothetical protein